LEEAAQEGHEPDMLPELIIVVDNDSIPDDYWEPVVLKTSPWAAATVF